MLSVSDNDATNAIIDRLGMPAVNAVADRLGLRHTALRRRMLDFELGRLRPRQHHLRRRPGAADGGAGHPG